MAAISRTLAGAQLLAMPTIAALQRMAADILIIDQADTLMRAKSTDQYLFTGWLNSGHTQGFSNPLSDPEDINGTIARSPFGSRALAGINLANTLDDTILSRSVIIHMRAQTLDDAMRERATQSVLNERATVLARRISAWAQEHAQALSAAIDDARFTVLADGSKLINRRHDIWGPLVTICHMAGDSWFKRITDAANDSTDPDTGPILTVTDKIDAELRALMRGKRITVTSFLDRNRPPLRPELNFPVSNDDLGYPAPRYGSKALPGASLVINTERNAAELRFAASTFGDVCEAINRKKRNVTAAYKNAGRLHVGGERSSLRAPMYSGQGDTTIIAIDISHWFWTDQPAGMTRTEKEIERILSATDENNVWGV